LSKRVSDLLDLQKRQTTARPAQNPLAYVLALFCPGARFGVLGIVISFYIILITFSTGLVPLVTKMQQRAEAAAEKARTDLEEMQQSRSGESDADETSEPAASESPN
jgi:hypothetical protein